MVHDNRSVLIVDLRIHPRVSDQVDDPLLSLILRQVESLRQVVDIDPLVNLAVTLRNQMSGSLNESIGGSSQEEVVSQHFLGLAKLLLGLLEVEIDVESGNELRYWVGIFIRLLLDDSDEILELLLVLCAVASSSVAVGDDGSGKVSENPWARSLDGVDVGGGEEEVDENILSGVVVEEWEKSPVNQPGAVLQLSQWVVEKLLVNHVLNLLNLLHGGIPVHEEDLTSKLTPGSRSSLLGVGRL